MAQTKWGSFVEAWANIFVGFSINFFANLWILPWFGFHVTPSSAFLIGVIFTVISLARSYVLRRWFNGLKFGNVPDTAKRGPTPKFRTDVIDKYEVVRSGGWVADLRCKACQHVFILNAGEPMPLNCPICLH